MSAIKIDQAGLPAGVAGVSRTDGKADGSVVTLENVDPTGFTQFRLLWGPPDDTTAAATLAPVPGNPDIWSFTPTPESYGTYLVELLEDGLRIDVRVFGVRTPGKRLLIPALNELASKLASWVNDGPDQVALSQDNAVDYPAAELNALPYAGWWRAMHELYLAVESVANGVDGQPGAQGPEGPEGPQGEQGLQGPQGMRGATGAAGAAGAQGPEGPEGPQGEQGLQGQRGATGAAGATGAQGPEGPEGPEGPQGMQGPQGLQGADGLQPGARLRSGPTLQTSGAPSVDYALALPAGIQAGDLLIAIVGRSHGVASTPAQPSLPVGWTTLLGNSGANAAGPPARGLAQRACYRVADGTEGSTLTFLGTSGSTDWASAFYVVKRGSFFADALTPANMILGPGAAAVGSSTGPNPPNVITGWGTGETHLWIVETRGAQFAATGTNDAAFWRTFQTAGGAGVAAIAVAHAYMAVDSYDAQPFSIAQTDSTTGHMIAVRGNTVGATGATGAAGAQGPEGPEGPEGPQGMPGPGLPVYIINPGEVMGNPADSGSGAAPRPLSGAQVGSLARYATNQTEATGGTFAPFVLTSSSIKRLVVTATSTFHGFAMVTSGTPLENGMEFVVENGGAVGSGITVSFVQFSSSVVGGNPFKILLQTNFGTDAVGVVLGPGESQVFRYTDNPGVGGSARVRAVGPKTLASVISAGTMLGNQVDAGSALPAKPLTGAEQGENLRVNTRQTVPGVTGIVDIALNDDTTILVLQLTGDATLRSLSNTAPGDGRLVRIEHDAGAAFTLTLGHNLATPTYFPFFNPNERALNMRRGSTANARSRSGFWRPEYASSISLVDDNPWTGIQTFGSSFILGSQQSESAFTLGALNVTLGASVNKLYILITGDGEIQSVAPAAGNPTAGRIVYCQIVGGGLKRLKHASGASHPTLPGAQANLLLPNNRDAIVGNRTAFVLTGDGANGWLVSFLPADITAWQLAPVDALNMAPTFAMRVAFAAGVAGTPDDVNLYVGAHFAYRILRVEPHVSTAIAGQSLEVRSATGGGGAALSHLFSAAVIGPAAITTPLTATATVAAGGNAYLRRSDRGVAGEVILTCMRT